MSQLFELFGKRVPTRLIEFFLENPTTEFYEKEIMNKTKLAKGSVNTWLNMLEKIGILTLNRKGLLKIYKLNSYNSMIKQLKILKNIDLLYPKAKTFKNVQIFLYGSSASGENNEKSDIDVLVIGKDRSIINEIKRINPKISVSFYTPIEWSKAARKDVAFFENVKKQNIRLI
jgi:predicted nucleotidyltransferase